MLARGLAEFRHILDTHSIAARTQPDQVRSIHAPGWSATTWPNLPSLSALTMNSMNALRKPYPPLDICPSDGCRYVGYPACADLREKSPPLRVRSRMLGITRLQHAPPISLMTQKNHPLRPTPRLLCLGPPQPHPSSPLPAQRCLATTDSRLKCPPPTG